MWTKGGNLHRLICRFWHSWIWLVLLLSICQIQQIAIQESKLTDWQRSVGWSNLLIQLSYLTDSLMWMWPSWRGTCSSLPSSSIFYLNKPQHDKTNKMTYTPSEDSDHHGHPHSLIRVFVVRFIGFRGYNVSSWGQQSLNFVMLQLKFQRQEGYFSNNNHVQKLSNFKREQNAKWNWYERFYRGFTYTSSVCNWMHSVIM